MKKLMFFMPFMLHTFFNICSPTNKVVPKKVDWPMFSLRRPIGSIGMPKRENILELEKEMWAKRRLDIEKAKKKCVQEDDYESLEHLILLSNISKQLEDIRIVLNKD